MFQALFAWKNESDRSVKSRTTGAALPLSCSFEASLPMEPAVCCVLIALQSLRHGFAVPPPFTQGRLTCGETARITCNTERRIETSSFSVRQTGLHLTLHLFFSRFQPQIKLFI